MKIFQNKLFQIAALTSLIIIFGAYTYTGEFHNSSSELGYIGLSPLGTLGGAIIPASCESGLGEGGYQHFAPRYDEDGNAVGPADTGTPYLSVREGEDFVRVPAGPPTYCYPSTPTPTPQPIDNTQNPPTGNDDGSGSGGTGAGTGGTGSGGTGGAGSGGNGSGSGGGAPTLCSSAPNSCGMTQLSYAVPGNACPVPPPNDSSCGVPNLKVGFIVNSTTFLRSTQTINKGERCTIYWDATPATSCTVSGGGFLYANGGTGNVRTPIMNNSTVYTIRCFNGNSVFATKTFNCQLNPTIKEVN